jgi:WXG100 family type VII secretion target
MSGTIGAEMGQLQDLARKFEQEAHTVQTLTSSINSQVGATWWKGGAADRFRHSWEGEFRPALQKLQQALQEASTEVKNRHKALEQAGG